MVLRPHIEIKILRHYKITFEFSKRPNAQLTTYILYPILILATSSAALATKPDVQLQYLLQARAIIHNNRRS